jgi:hypothetical protein
MRRMCPCVLALLALAASAGADEKVVAPGVAVDKEARTVSVECKIAPRKLDHPQFKGEVYPIEVIACWPFRADPPGGQKAHETVVTFDFNVKPSEVHKALESLGLKPGKPVYGDVKEKASGPAVKIFLEFAGPDGQPKRVPIERCLLGIGTNKPMPKVEWRFTGSVMRQPDPNKPQTVYGADLTGTLISIFPVTDQTVFQTDMTMKEEKYVKLETDKKLLPK